MQSDRECGKVWPQAWLYWGDQPTCSQCGLSLQFFKEARNSDFFIKLRTGREAFTRHFFSFAVFSEVKPLLCEVRQETPTTKTPDSFHQNIFSSGHHRDQSPAFVVLCPEKHVSWCVVLLVSRWAWGLPGARVVQRVCRH